MIAINPRYIERPPIPLSTGTTFDVTKQVQDAFNQHKGKISITFPASNFMSAEPEITDNDQQPKT